MKERFFSDRILWISYLGAMTMVAVEVSLVVAAFAFGIIFWRFGSEKWGWPRLNKILTGILSVLVLIQVLFEFRTLIGQEPSYTLLLGLSALRVMEYESTRDKRFVILLGFVLLAVKALFTIDIYWIVPTTFCFVGFWYSLLPKAFPGKFRYLRGLFIKSFPMALLLFVLFPRLVIPWAMTRGTPQGEIGFSDELNPGAVANLASTDKIAFRARFLSSAKDISELYWRGSVLNRSLGLSWKPSRQLFQPQAPSKNLMTPQYEVALDATSKVFLFVLDPTKRIQTQDQSVLEGEGQQFRLQRPLQKAIVYQGELSSEPSSATPSEQDLKIPNLTGQTQDWVQQQNSKKMSEGEKLEVLKAFFSQPEFAYTLNPGTYGPDEMNEFLFDRKKGFCEHFAGSYATLARALGIPARVVVGYHGGLFNEYGGFWRVSQKDAHAWAEVFFENRWLRVDPTSWVAPLRLRIGAESFFELSEADQQAFARSLDFRPRLNEEIFNFENISFWLESLNYRWIYLLIEFDLEAQADLLRSFLDFRWILFFLLVVSAVLYGVLYRLKNPQNLKIEEQILKAVEVWGQKRSKPRRVSETPLEYFERLSSQTAEGFVLQKASKLYEKAVYQKSLNPADGELRKILQEIQRLKRNT